MEVILLEKMGKLGDLGDKVKVKAGYGRNYLLPFGKAVAATEANTASFEARRAELEASANEKRSAAEVRAAALAELSLVIEAQAGEGGKLFGSVGPRDVAEVISVAGVVPTCRWQRYWSRHRLCWMAWERLAGLLSWR